MKIFSSSSFNVYFVLTLLIGTSYFRRTRAQQRLSFDGVSYNCSTNIICLTAAHRANLTYVGSLSLIQEKYNDTLYGVGLAYSRIPVRLRHLNDTASFRTSFSFNQIANPYFQTEAGDGIAFVMSADNQTSGAPGKYLGFYQDDGTRPFKSIAVEFDNYYNPEEPPVDIAWNHVSLDFMNVTFVAAKNASDVGVELWKNSTVYAWIEYSAVTHQFEVRISNNNSRPINPLLNYTVDLFDRVEELMWVGFSGATGGKSSYYYIRDWDFESYGLSLPPDHAKSRRKLRVVFIVVLLILVGGVVGICFIVYLTQRLHLGRESFNEDLRLQLADMPEGYRFSYKQLSVATNAFSDETKLGEGGFGSVHHGVLLTSGAPMAIAVKKIRRESDQGEREFTAEVSIISQLRHRNLIQLLGWCTDRGKYLIVYDLMPNGSLDKVLFGQDQNPLTWKQRFNIITGTAAALDYLHQGWKQQVIHRDVKASNIMLDDGWNAKLGDFGLARLVDHHRTLATTLVAGTIGYLAPETIAVGRFTDKTDVFSFGAVALEVACGRHALNLSKSEVVPKDEVVLVDWVWQRLSVGDLMSVVDKRLSPDDYDTHQMKVVLVMGLLCSHPDAMARPTMRQVVQVLAGDAPVPPIPAAKPAPVFWTASRILSIDDLLNCSNPTSNCTRTSSPRSRSSSYR